MNKVAILTTHRANNFGAVLQAYSLVKAVRELGAEGYILDWRCPHFEWLYHKAWRIRYNPLTALKHLVHYIQYENIVRSKFDMFRALMPMTNPIWEHKDLSKVVDSYKAVIVGSDQVWNPTVTAQKALNFDRSFLLDFVLDSSKKFAYAASISIDKIEPRFLLSEFEKAWKSFNIITTRERKGALYVAEIAKRKACAVLDPVFLHDANYWAGIEHPIHIKEPFVFDYNIKHDDVLNSRLEAYAYERNLRIVRPLIPGQLYKPDRHTLFIGPQEFLWALHHAESVFTSSFHAAAFSIIFGKRLVVRSQAGMGLLDSRFDVLNEVAKQKPSADKDGVLIFNLSERNENLFEERRKESFQFLAQMVGRKI